MSLQNDPETLAQKMRDGGVQAMADAEILEELRKHFQIKVNNLNADEMAEGPFEDGDDEDYCFGRRWEEAAARIDARGGLRIRFEFGKPEDG